MNSTRQLINSSGNHSVQICLTESCQADLVTRYIKDGLINGEAIIVIAKPALRKVLKLKMDALSFDGHLLKDHNQVRFFDAAFLLSTLDGILEEELFQRNVAAPMYNAHSDYKKVRVYNEMVDILWKQGQHDMAVKLEGFWNDLSDRQEFSLLSTYSLNKLNPNAYDEALERICKYHAHLIPQEDNSPVGQGMGETMLSVFGAAWDRVVGKSADSQQIAGQIQSTLT